MSATRPRPWNWPDPLVGFEPDWAGQFDTFDDWVNHASRALTGATEAVGSMGQKVSAVCIDAKGRRCTIGKDFVVARDEDAFPIRYFWSFRPFAPAQDAAA